MDIYATDIDTQADPTQVTNIRTTSGGVCQSYHKRISAYHCLTEALEKSMVHYFAMVIQGKLKDGSEEVSCKVVTCTYDP